MTDKEVLESGKITCVEAARYLGVDPVFLRVCMEKEKLPIGTCLKGQGGRWSFYINPALLVAYKNGELNTVLMAEVQDLKKRVKELEGRI